MFIYHFVLFNLAEYSHLECILKGNRCLWAHYCKGVVTLLGWWLIYVTPKPYWPRLVIALAHYGYRFESYSHHTTPDWPDSLKYRLYIIRIPPKRGNTTMAWNVTSHVQVWLHYLFARVGLGCLTMTHAAFHNNIKAPKCRKYCIVRHHHHQHHHHHPVGKISGDIFI